MLPGRSCRRTRSGIATSSSPSRSPKRCASTARSGRARSRRWAASAAPSLRPSGRSGPELARAAGRSARLVDAQPRKRARIEAAGDHDIFGLLKRPQGAARGLSQDPVRRAGLESARVERLLSLANRRRAVLLPAAASGCVGLLNAERRERLLVQLARRLQLFRALKIHQRGLRLRTHASVDAAGPKAAIVQYFLHLAHGLGVDVQGVGSRRRRHPCDSESRRYQQIDHFHDELLLEWLRGANRASLVPPIAPQQLPLEG